MRLTVICLVAVCVSCAVIASPVAAQAPARPASANVLSELNAAIEALTTTVAPSVVQILVTGYQSVGTGTGTEAGLVIGRQHSVGSGAIIDADGYIVTNAHVVTGAQHVRVVLPAATAEGGVLESLVSAAGTTVPAQIVGIAQDIDLALLKIEASNLRPLALANYEEIRQGELVFAFGSPEGLRNSVTMGVVSSVARQLDPDSPGIYVQTDAPINPGNSGGPLVNVKGQLVGLNTLILSGSGGSQGVGFAIPSLVLASAIPQLRDHGHLHRGMVGINVQGLTPQLAADLELPGASGVIVSDVMPDSPADLANVHVRDIITSVDGRPVGSVPAFMLALSTHAAGDTITLGLVHDGQTSPVSFVEQSRTVDDLNELTDPVKNAVPQLGIIGVDLDETANTLLPDLRIPSGVLVAARRLELTADSPLRAGDVIHAINTFTVPSLDILRVLLDGLQPDSQVTLQIERDHRLMFVTMVVY